MHYKKPNKAPRTVLIVCLRLIGDVILATPLIRLLKDAYPGVEIDFLVNRKTGEFLERDGRVRRVIYNERFDVATNRHLKDKKGYLGGIFGRYDMAIHLNYADRGSYATLFAGRRHRVGFYTSDRPSGFWKRVLFTHPLLYPGPRHRACLCEQVARSLHIPAERLEVKVCWNEADAARVAEVRRAHGIGAGYFVIHPFTRGRHKFWLMEHFAAVSDAIAERYGLTPVWTSSPAADEVARLAEAARGCRIAPVTLPGALTLNQVACFLKDARLYLGLDTAITHIAAAQATPSVVLYGASQNVYWFPWNNDLPIDRQSHIAAGTQHVGNTIVVQKDWECVPCGQEGCDGSGKSRCLEETTPEEVLAQVEKLLGPPITRSL